MKIITHLVYLFLAMSLLSACTIKKTSNNSGEKPESFGMTTKDALQISDAYIINIETMRKIMERTGFDNAPFTDFGGGFQLYAARLNLKTQRYEVSPLPTSTQLTVTVDTMTYSRDSLLCVALVIIDRHYTNMPQFENNPKDEYRYDGRAVIGCRDNISAPFQIYPFGNEIAMFHDNIKDVQDVLRRYYFLDIKNDGGATGSNLEGYDYKCGILSPEFFETAPPFLRNENGEYKFKYAKPLGGPKVEYKRDYPGNAEIYSEWKRDSAKATNKMPKL